jgi:hypothetical protein
MNSMIKQRIARPNMYYAEVTEICSIKDSRNSCHETSNQADCFFCDQVHGGSDNGYTTVHVKLTEENR